MSRHSADHVVVVAVALVDDLERPQQLLAARRSKPTNLAGRWEFPGGKVDPGETVEEALHRETLEELGVTVRLGSELAGPDGGGWRISPRYVLRLWTAVVQDGEPRPLVEHDALRWLGPGEWLDVPWLDADVRIVQELQSLHGIRDGAPSTSGADTPAPRATRGHVDAVGASAVRSRTGKDRDEWFGLLDTAGAVGWDHPRIARWLREEHSVDGWWAQGLTVGYEQARGLRAPGQRRDGGFDANVSRTLHAPAQEVWPWLTDPGLVERWRPAGLTVRGENPGRSVRWEAPDGSRVTVYLDAPRADRARLSVQHGKLEDEGAVAVAKDTWRHALGRLVDAISAG